MGGASEWGLLLTHHACMGFLHAASGLQRRDLLLNKELCCPCIYWGCILAKNYPGIRPVLSWDR